MVTRDVSLLTSVGGMGRSLQLVCAIRAASFLISLGETGISLGVGDFSLEMLLGDTFLEFVAGKPFGETDPPLESFLNVCSTLGLLSNSALVFSLSVREDSPMLFLSDKDMCWCDSEFLEDSIMRGIEIPSVVPGDGDRDTSLELFLDGFDSALELLSDRLYTSCKLFLGDGEQSLELFSCSNVSSIFLSSFV